MGTAALYLITVFHRVDLKSFGVDGFFLEWKLITQQTEAVWRVLHVQFLHIDHKLVLEDVLNLRV